MRTNQAIRIWRRTRVAVAFLTCALVAGQANAQYQPTGPDGITASPRVRQQLKESKARPVVSTVTMSCERCKDAWVAQPNDEPKGSGARALTGATTKWVVKHLCDGCQAEWKIAGTGKAKQAVAGHKCRYAAEQDSSCCALKAPGKAREGAPKKAWTGISSRAKQTSLCY